MKKQMFKIGSDLPADTLRTSRFVRTCPHLPADPENYNIRTVPAFEGYNVPTSPLSLADRRQPLDVSTSPLSSPPQVVITNSVNPTDEQFIEVFELDVERQLNNLVQNQLKLNEALKNELQFESSQTIELETQYGSLFEEQKTIYDAKFELYADCADLDLQVENELMRDLHFLSDVSPAPWEQIIESTAYVTHSLTPLRKSSGWILSSGGNSGGGGNNSGGRFGDNNNFGGDFNNGSNPIYVFIIYSLLIGCVLVILKFLYARYRIALRDLVKYLNQIINKDPKDPKRRAYVVFLKALVIAMAILIGPEAAELALSYLWRRILKIIRAAFYAALLASIFVGGTSVLLHWFEYLWTIIGPLLDKLATLLSGPEVVSLPALFVEKAFKAIFCSILYGSICVCVQRFKVRQTSKQKIQLVLIISCLSCCFYFILKDFTYLRAASIWLINNSTALHQLVHCQLGRLSLLIGCTVLMRQFVFLPGSPVMFVLLTYGLGVYTLAFNASANLFPKLK